MLAIFCRGLQSIRMTISLEREKGLDVYSVLSGANVPSHFLNQYVDGDKTFYVDCFNGGRILSR